MIYTLHNKFGKILWCSDKKTCYIASWNYQSRHESVSTRIQSWEDILKTSKLHAHGAQCFLTSITDRKESLHDTEQRKSQSLAGPPTAKSSINIEQGPVFPSTERNSIIVWNIWLLLNLFGKNHFGIYFWEF